MRGKERGGRGTQRRDKKSQCNRASPYRRTKNEEWRTRICVDITTEKERRRAMECGKARAKTTAARLRFTLTGADKAEHEKQ